MNALMTMLESTAAERIGWMLVHSLWQIALFAGAYLITRQALGRSSSSLRYMAGSTFLFCMLLALPITAVLIDVATDDDALAESGAAVIRMADPSASTVVPNPTISDGTISSSDLESTFTTSIAPPLSTEAENVSSQADTSTQTKANTPPQASDLAEQISDVVTPLLPWVVASWLVGVGLLAIRQLGGWLIVHRLCRTATFPVAADIQQKLQQLSKRIGIHRSITLVSSMQVSIPSVVGHFSPVILFPASLLSGLSPQEIELILAHELAHIRRHDYLMNLIQTTCETLLFYHPAVWWISRKIRQERENCCDDIAMDACGDRTTYARALASLAEKTALPAAAVAATGGSLLARIRRIVGQPASPKPSGSMWLAGAFVLLVCCAIPISMLYAIPEPVVSDAASKPGYQELTKAVSEVFPEWKNVKSGRYAEADIGSAEASGIFLNKETQEYIGQIAQQQKAAAPEPKVEPDDPNYRTVYSHIDIITFDENSDLPNNLREKIAWVEREDTEGLHLKVVDLGTGMGRRWFVRTTIPRQHLLRTKLKLAGGDDPIQLLTDALVIEDKHSHTANSVGVPLAEYGNKALNYIERALQQAKTSDDRRRFTRPLRNIRTAEADQLLLKLYQSPETKDAAGYAVAYGQPREGVQPIYLGLVDERRYLAHASKACVEFDWQNAKPLLEEIYDTPKNWSELEVAYLALRNLDDIPVADSLTKAEQQITTSFISKVSGAIRDQARQTILDSPDKEGAAFIAARLANYRGFKVIREKAEAIRRFGRELLVDMADDAKPLVDKVRNHFEDKNIRKEFGEILNASNSSNWGENVQGVQCRLQNDRDVWNLGDTPTFKIDIHNHGSKIWPLPPGQELFDIQVDGRWYSYSGPIGVVHPLVEPGDGLTEIPLFIDKGMFKLFYRANSKPELLKLPLAPGRHTIRVAFFTSGGGPDNFEQIRVVSNPVAIDVVEYEKSELKHVQREPQADYLAVAAPGSSVQGAIVSDQVPLTAWFEGSPRYSQQLSPDADAWLLLRGKAFIGQGRLWIDQIQRQGNRFVIKATMANWTGIVGESIAYRSYLGINLGRLSAGTYETEWQITNGSFKEADFDATGRPTAPLKPDGATKVVKSTFEIPQLPPEAQAVLDRMNAQCADEIWRAEIDQIERPETRPANKAISGEVIAFVSECKEQLAALNATTRWNAKKGSYEAEWKPNARGEDKRVKTRAVTHFNEASNALLRLANQYLPDHEAIFVSGNKLRITWKTKVYDVPRRTGKHKDAKLVTRKETGPASDGLILTAWISQEVGQAERPQTLENGGFWKTYLGELEITDGKQWLIFNLEYGPKTDKRLIEVFSTPEKWLTVKSLDDIENLDDSVKSFRASARKRFSETPGRSVSIDAITTPSALGVDWKIDSKSTARGQARQPDCTDLIILAQGKTRELAGADEVILLLKVFPSVNKAREYALTRAFAGAAQTSYLLARAKRYFGRPGPGDFRFGPHDFVRGNVVVELRSDLNDAASKKIFTEIDKAIDGLVEKKRATSLQDAQQKIVAAAVAMKPSADGIIGGQQTTGLDLSVLLKLSGQQKDFNAFTDDHRYFDRDTQKLLKQQKTWALCALLDHENVDAKIYAVRRLLQLADPDSLPVLLAAAKRNNYVVAGSESATLHYIYRSTLKAAMEKITGQQLTPAGLRVTTYPEPGKAKVIRSEDDPSYFEEEVDFAKVEKWLRSKDGSSKAP